jgi:hypothetical protein
MKFHGWDSLRAGPRYLGTIPEISTADPAESFVAQIKKPPLTGWLCYLVEAAGIDK